MTAMSLFKPLRRRRPLKAKQNKLFLNSEHAPCTCPEPCERDHGNE